MSNKKIRPEEFIKAYMSEYKKGGSAASLAKSMGVGVSSVYPRIKSLTKRGVVLPDLAGYTVYSPARVAELNKLVKENSDE